MFLNITQYIFQQACRTGSGGLASGLQVPPQGISNQAVNQPSELMMQQSHLNRAQSVTSAVDYEYFDVGIGQVLLILTDVHKSLPKIELSLICYPPLCQFRLW